VGEPNVNDERDEDKFTADETESIEGYCSRSPSSDGRHVSTMASKQFTNSSALSAVQLDLVNGPANLHNPPKPTDCK